MLFYPVQFTSTHLLVFNQQTVSQHESRWIQWPGSQDKRRGRLQRSILFLLMSATQYVALIWHLCSCTCLCRCRSDPSFSPARVWSSWIAAVRLLLCRVCWPSHHIHSQFPQQHKDPAERHCTARSLILLLQSTKSTLWVVYSKSGVFILLVIFIWAAEIKAFWTQVRHTGRYERVSGFMSLRRQMLTSDNQVKGESSLALWNGTYYSWERFSLIITFEKQKFAKIKNQDY